MAKKNIFNPVSVSVGAAVMASALTMSTLQASENPFAANELHSGFMVAEKGKEGACGASNEKGKEGMCGEDKSMQEGKCGEGKCGEGKCGAEKKEKSKEGKCGEKSDS